jgi:hypothetical protein
MVTSNGVKPGFVQELQTSGGEGPAVHQVPQGPQEVLGGVEAREGKERLQGVGHAVDISHHEDAAGILPQVLTGDNGQEVDSEGPGTASPVGKTEGES